MRVLFVGPDLFYTNPAGRYLPSVLDCIANVSFFGPGYVSTKDLSAGLIAFIERNGPFDIVFTTEKLGLLDTDIDFTTEIEAYCRLYSFGFPASDLQFLPFIASELRTLKLPRVLSLLQNDIFSWNDAHADLALASSDVILGSGLENVVKVDDMQFRSEEPWSMDATDVFVNLLSRFPSRFASFPHFVADTEICRTPHVLRSKKWEVPGVRYRARRIAADKLTSSGYRLSQRPPSVYIHKAAAIFKKMHSAGIRASQYLFRRQLEGARAVYTCGSVVRHPIRKFFEIPAAGALLVCEPCPGLSHYGFEDGKSCLMVSPEEVLEVDKLLTSDPERVQGMARQAQQLVINKHSIHARASQLSCILSNILSGKFAGAHWSNGDYVHSLPPDCAFSSISMSAK